MIMRLGLKGICDEEIMTLEPWQYVMQRSCLRLWQYVMRELGLRSWQYVMRISGLKPWQYVITLGLRPWQYMMRISGLRPWQYVMRRLGLRGHGICDKESPPFSQSFFPEKITTLEKPVILNLKKKIPLVL